MRRFPLIHRPFAPLVNRASAVTDDNIIGWNSHDFQQLNTSNRCGAGAIANNLDAFHVATGQVKRIDQTRSGNDGGAMLIIMENRNIQLVTKLLFNDKTFRCLDIFEVDSAKGWRHQLDRADKSIGIGCV